MRVPIKVTRSFGEQGLKLVEAAVPHVVLRGVWGLGFPTQLLWDEELALLPT